MQARENKEQIKKNNDIYQSVILERRRFLTYKNMRDKPGDVEAMVKALFEHFEKIRKTCFSSMAKENYSGVGSFEMITESNRALRALEKELKQFTVQKDDLRFSLYSMIIVMLQDNISMRLWINDLMQNQIEDSKRRLEDHVKLQSQKLIAEESKRQNSYSMDKYDQSRSKKQMRNRDQREVSVENSDDLEYGGRHQTKQASAARGQLKSNAGSSHKQRSGRSDARNEHYVNGGNDNYHTATGGGPNDPFVDNLNVPSKSKRSERGNYKNKD